MCTRREEKKCRFSFPGNRNLGNPYFIILAALGKGLPQPAESAMANIYNENQTYRLRLWPGEKGKQMFVTEVRNLLGIKEASVSSNSPSIIQL
jgi:hypothetical protein